MIRAVLVRRGARPHARHAAAPIVLLSARKNRRLLLRLARELEREGWTTRRLSDAGWPRLRVFCPGAPVLGETVWLAYQGGRWWYRSSANLWLAPIEDPVRAAAGIVQVLGPRLVESRLR
ncbi:hypothetical protein [Actinomadura hibisca]|uniref:hypothetical protein n=1 Tax=Actinomadura hibisca TaxID=68565 RepID=UPI00082F5B82|nr:hypothetical protein [Actinomadura hibisca]